VSPADPLATLTWPGERAAEALRGLSDASGLLGDDDAERCLALPGAGHCGDAPATIASAAATLGLATEPVTVFAGECASFLRRGGPALLAADGAGEGRILVLLASRWGRVTLLAPDGCRKRLAAPLLQRFLRSAAAAAVAPEVDALLARLRLPGRLERRTRAAILSDRLREIAVGHAWLIGLPPGASFWRQLRRARLARRLIAVLAAHLARYLLLVLAWWLLGSAVLAARIDPSWLPALALLLLSVPPCRAAELVAATRLLGDLAILLRRRLLAGILRLDPDALRMEGSGHLLARLLDAEGFETLALAGGHGSLLALLELALAVPLLAWGAAGGLLVLLLVVWMAAILLAARGYLARRRVWSRSRLALTHDLVEKMLGHRTRLVEEDPARRHEEEDRALAAYHHLSRRLDARAAILATVVERGWLLAALAVLTPAFVAGLSTARLAAAVGAILFAARALGRLSAGSTDLAEAALAWTEVGPIFRAGGDGAAPPGLPPLPAADLVAAAPADPVIEARALAYGRAGSARPLFAGCDLTIRSGDRLLLTGSSSSGKSTFAAVLAGLRPPTSGLLLVGGLDRHSRGALAWRRLVAAVPQAHENLVLGDSLAFNLLFGRAWPPAPADLAAAEAVCRDLALGDLLDRLPTGLWQRVGEGGWQLSHGEQARLFLARALLQDPELVIADESLASLDPLTCQQVLDCLRRRARSLLLIAHT
jgi:ATP-binding cassette subfamily B protein